MADNHEELLANLRDPQWVRGQISEHGTLDLDERSIGDEGVAVLAGTLRTLKSETPPPDITDVMLHNNNIGPAGVPCILQIVEDYNPQKLFLTDNPLGTEGLKALEGLKNSAIIELCLYNTGITGDNAGSVVTIVNNNPGIKDLALANNNLGTEGLKALEGVKNSALTDLWLSNTGITGDNVGSVVTIVNNNPGIGYLDLSGNNLGTEGLKALEGVKNSALTDLWLSNTGITGDNVGSVVTIVNNNPGIGYLDLSGNNLGTEGLKALEGVKNSALTDLWLSNTGITGDNVGSVVTIVNNNPGIGYLDLSDNNLGDEGAKILAAGLEENNTAATIYLNNNMIGVEGANALMADGVKERLGAFEELAAIISAAQAAGKAQPGPQPAPRPASSGGGSSYSGGSGASSGRSSPSASSTQSDNKGNNIFPQLAIGAAGLAALAIGAKIGANNQKASSNPQNQSPSQPVQEKSWVEKVAPWALGLGGLGVIAAAAVSAFNKSGAGRSH